MRLTLASLLLALLFTGCGKTDVNEILSQAATAAEQKTADGWKEAHDLLSEALEDHEVDSSNARDLHLVALARTGDSEGAIKAAEAVLADDTDAFVANYLLGSLHIAAKRDQDAIPYLRTAHNLKPDHNPTTVLYATCAGRLNLDEAEELFTKLIESDYQDPGHLHNELAVWYANRQQYPFAMSHFSKAGNEENALVYLNMAIVADYHMKKADVARTYYLNFLYHANKEYPEREGRVRERLRVLSTL